MSVKSFIAFAVVGAFACGVAAQDSPPAVIEAVAHVGDPAPGIPGFTFAYLVQPAIDADGNVLVTAFLDGPGVSDANNMAVFHGPPGNLQKLVWESEQAPDMPEGVIISSLLTGWEHMSENGWIAFTASVSGPGIEPGFNDRLLYVGPPGDLRKVLQGGDQAPGCEPGVYIDVDPFTSLGGRLSDNGTLLVFANLAGSGVPYDDAWWIGTRDSLELVYRRGMAAPGCEEGVNFLWADCVTHNDAGQIACRGALAGPGVTSANDRGRWLGGPGTLVKMAREADPVPGMDKGVTWKSVPLGAAVMNGFGELAESGTVQGTGVTEANDRVLLLGLRADGIDELGPVLVREDTPLPDVGPGVTIGGSLGNCLINNRGDVFYGIKLAGSGITESNQWAMYFGPLGDARLDLRDGDPAPTFTPDVTLWRIVMADSLAVMNDVGDIVTVTQIAGPGVTDEDNVVLWLRHRLLERWIPLLRTGDAIDGRAVYAVDEYEFLTAYYCPTGGADGMAQSLNDQGMLAIRLEFTDGTNGVYRISPPVFADADQDGDFDADDWLYVSGCWTGPDSGVTPDCDVFDLDRDGDVDLWDQAVIQRLLQGEATEEEGGAEWGSGSTGQGGYVW